MEWAGRWEVRERQKDREIWEMGVRSKREGVLRYGRMKKTEGKMRRKEREETRNGRSKDQVQWHAFLASMTMATRFNPDLAHARFLAR